jgi:hypothetical protein
MDGRSVIWVLNVVENVFESSNVDDQPDRIQGIFNWTIRKDKDVGCSTHFYTTLTQYL